MVKNTYLLFIIVITLSSMAYIAQEKYNWAKKISGCMLALILGMILSNFNIIVTDSPAYDFVWDYILPFSLPFLLWSANIKNIFKDSKRLLGIYLISAFGTVIGVVLAYLLLHNFIDDLGKIGAMMCGTYIGGSVNLVAISDMFQVDKSILSAGIVADNFLMVLYFFVLIALPNMEFFKKRFVKKKHKSKKVINEEKLTVSSFISSCILSLIIVFLSKSISSYFGNIQIENLIGNTILVLLSSQYIWITTFSVCIATFFSKSIESIVSTRVIGEYCMHMFFVVIGIPASFMMIVHNMPLLFVFNFIIVFTNMIISLLGGKLFHYSLESICVASNANIGGPTTAAAYATSKGWDGLVVPAILIGTLGYVIGNYAGILIGTFL